MNSHNENLVDRIRSNRDRFSEIYALTLQLCGLSGEEAHCSNGPKKCWLDILKIWMVYRDVLKCDNVFFAALYYIQWRRHHYTVKSVQLKKLLCLVAKEILDDGYAFKAWRTTDAFNQAFESVISSVRSNARGHRKWHSSTFRRYIYCRTFSLVIYKGTVPEGMLMYMSRRNARKIKTAAELREYYTWFEQNVCRLLPEAKKWDEEWSREDYIMNRMKAVHGVDFTVDYDDFDRLIETVGLIENRQSYTKSLLSVKNFTFSMAETLWGKDAAKVVQRHFSLAYRNFQSFVTKSRVRNTTSTYSREKIMGSWVYQLLDEWRVTKDSRLSHEVCKKMFQLGINV